MGGREDDVADEVVALELGPGHPTATAALGLERVGLDRLDVAGLGHHDHQLLVVDQVQVRHLALVEHDRGHPGRGELLLDGEQVVLDDGPQAGVVVEDGLELGDLLAQLLEPLLDVDPGEAGQLAEAHLQDVLGLELGEPEALHEATAGRGPVLAGADEGDHLVDHVEGPQQALLDLLVPAGLVQAVLRPAGDDLDLVRDVALERLHQVERAGHAVDQRHHVDGEAGLQLRLLEQVVQHDVGVGVPAQADDEVGLAAGRVVVDVGDALELAGVDQLLDAPGDGLAAGLVGQLGDDDLHAAAPASRLLDGGLGPHLHAAPAGAVGLHDPGPAHDEAARREVGTLHEAHEVVRRGVRVVDQVDGGVDDLAQVVGRDVGGHADRDALAAVDQQVGEAGGQDDGLLVGPVVGRLEVDGVLVDVRDHLHGERVQAALRVALGRRPEVGRAVVAVEVDERVAQREGLGHAHEGVIDRAVAVRMELGHRVAGDAGALDEGAVGPEALLLHVPDDPPVHRLEAVAHVRQGAGHDDGHGVVQEGPLHLLLDLDRLDGAEERGRPPRRRRGAACRRSSLICPGTSRRGRSAG